MKNLRTLITFTQPLDAHIAGGFLESAGIETFIKDEFTAQVYNFYSNAIGGVKLQVYEDEYVTGIEILRNGGYIIDEDQEETPIEIVPLTKTTDKTICPFCHSTNIGKKKEPNILTVVVYFILGGIFPIFKKSYTCYDCERVWKYRKEEKFTDSQI